MADTEFSPSEEIHAVKFSRGRRHRTMLVIAVVLAVLLLVAFITVIILAVRLSEANTNQDDHEAETSQGKAKSIHDMIDQDTDPCEDFYQYACGAWIAKREIPSGHGRVDLFVDLALEINGILKGLLEAEKKDGDPDYFNKAKDFYSSCTNAKKDNVVDGIVKVVESLGGSPYATPGWDEDTFDVVDMAVKVFRMGSSALFQFAVLSDFRRSTQRVLTIDQTDLAFPSRNHYLVPENDTTMIQYRALITATALQLGGNATVAEQDAVDVVDFEIKLAKISLSSEEARDFGAQYQSTTLETLHEQYKQVFDWKRFVYSLLTTDGVKVELTDKEVISVRSPAFFKRLVTLLQKTPKRVLANYMTWRVVLSFSDKKPEVHLKLLAPYKSAHSGATSEGVVSEVECIMSVSYYFGYGITQQYIKEHFNDDARAELRDMTKNIRQAFTEILEDIDWMDEPSKLVAREKVNNMNFSVGYPDIVYNSTYLHKLYENYTYTPDDFILNLFNSRKENIRDVLQSLRLPVDREQWPIPPTTINAFYNFLTNLIMLPVGILQPAFFSLSQPRSVNYARVGFIIGHEITHGFDDQGRQFDQNANLADWWSQSAVTKFRQKSQCIVDQYDNFFVESINMTINGVNTQGENIADNGGLKESYRAYRNWVARQGKEEDALPRLNYTHDQLFFVSYAQTWCQKSIAHAEKESILADTHTLNRFRIIGSLQNSHEFSEVFKCKPGSMMNAVNKCKVW